jgi:hypothetical protein
MGMKDRPEASTAAGGPSGEHSQDIIVYRIRVSLTCQTCGIRRRKGRFMRRIGKQRQCLACAGLGHLVFVPRGDVALTRRASKYAMLCVVVRSSWRRRHKRLGLLVEEGALERAKRELLADAPARERARERAAQRRAEQDERYVGEFAKHLGDLFPGCPVPLRRAIAAYACQKYSNRVGRTAAAKRFDPKAINIAVRAHIRHRHTPYDQLRAQGIPRGAARTAVNGAIEKLFERWRRPKG